MIFFNRIFVFCFCFFYILFFCNYSYCNDNFVFSDELYYKLISNSDDFKNIDAIINNNFKKLLNNLNLNDKKKFILWQKNWLDKYRNQEINYCIDNIDNIFNLFNIKDKVEWCIVQSFKSRNYIIDAFINNKEIKGYGYKDKDGKYYKLNISPLKDLPLSEVYFYIDNYNHNNFNTLFDASKLGFELIVNGKLSLEDKYYLEPTMVMGYNSDINLKIVIGNDEFKIVEFNANKYSDDNTYDIKNILNANAQFHNILSKDINKNIKKLQKYLDNL